MTDNLVDGAGRAPRGRAGARRRRHLPRRRRRQGHGDVLGHRQPRLRRVRLLARRRVRLRRLGRLRPQGARHHRARRVGVGQAPLPRARRRRAGRRVHRRRHRRHVGRRVRQRHAAVGAHPAAWPPTTTGTSSSTPTRIRPRRSPSGGGCSSCPARRGTTTRARCCPRAAACTGATRSRSSCPPQAREALGLDEERLAPNDVIRAILRAQVDLLWNGGIGTVVKASYESDADAADRASDAIRVDARELRCRVVGEGGNLGFTRRARVEYSAGGGRINADFIDNSAGVDCSDHEVNLKILLGLAERRGEMTRAGARRAARGGHRGRRRARALRLVPAGADHRPGGRPLGRAPVRLRGPDGDARGARDPRPREREPADATRRSTERRRSGRGLERPELAILLAYSKRLRGARARAQRTSSTDPWFERDLRAYFPAAVVERCGHLLGEHQLRTPADLHGQRERGRQRARADVRVALVASAAPTSAEVVRAFRIAVEVTGADARWETIERLDGVDRAAQMELLGGDRRARRVDHPLVPHLGAGCRHRDDDRGRPRRLRAARRGAAEARHRRAARGARRRPPSAWSGDGVPEDVASAHALRAELVHAPDMVAVADLDRPPDRGRRTGLLRGRRRAAARLDGARAGARPVRDADAALGAAGGARGRVQGAPRPGRGGAAAEPGGRSGRRLRALPARRRRAARGGSTPSCARWRARASRTWPASRSRCASSARWSADLDQPPQLGRDVVADRELVVAPIGREVVHVVLEP